MEYLKNNNFYNVGSCKICTRIRSLETVEKFKDKIINITACEMCRASMGECKICKKVTCIKYFKEFDIPHCSPCSW